MIIHIFNERISVFKELSLTASSMYPIYVDGKIVANVISDDDGWVLKPTDGYYSPEAVKDAVKLQQYYIYNIISNKTKEVYNVVLSLRYFPDARVYAISNQLIVGNTSACDICLPVKNVKNDFIKLTLTDGGWVANTESRNFFIGRNRATDGQKILCGDSISYYGLKIIILHNSFILCSPFKFIKKSPRIRPAGPEPVYEPKQTEGDNFDIDTPLYTENDYYYKSPRFNYTIEKASLDIDEPPTRDKQSKMPLISTLGPQLTMAAASGISIISLVAAFTSGVGDELRIKLSIATMAISLVGALLWPTVNRALNNRRYKKQEERRQTKYRAYLAEKKQQLDSIENIQKQILLTNHPDIRQCEQIVKTRSDRLWQRNIDHSDFLAIRVGLGTVKTELELEEPKDKFSVEDTDPLFLELKKIIRSSHEIEEAPITYNFTNQIIDAVIGQPDVVKRFMDCVFLQMLTFHSYADLKIVVFTTEPEKWDYLKIAPHCWDNEHSTRYFATTIEKLSIITNELEKVFDSRKANDEEEKLEDDGEKKTGGDVGYKDFRPYYLFFVDDMTAVRNVSLINKILYYKRNIGFSIVTIAQNVTMLPNETADFISITTNRSAIIKTGEDESQQFFIADFNTNNTVDMNLCMQSMANIPMKVEKGRFELPKSLPFLEMYECGRVEQLNSLARWKENDPSISLSVPIGVDQNSEIFRMDIHEKAYGPHGLIAGTTGSGKSEWIITYILSLAANFSPNEVQFVLIDYKGGGLAKSFENGEAGIKLPHLAGTITNLDKSDIFRAISAIESELKRRQSLFNNAREKLHEGSMDIYKYQQYFRQGVVDEPLSHLLIICDEFAELRQQEPDFMDQLISTSRIGRSLGVHLILATQKPSGVVNEQIWSNSKFKIALKVQNKSDSQEIIKKPDAAFLKQTGSFYLQVGADDYFNLGQVAWTGAKYYPSNTAKRKIDDSVQCIDDVGRVTNVLKNEEATKDQGEQLFNIVSYLSDISKKTVILSRPMWLTNIKQKTLLADVRKKYGVLPAKKYTYSTLIGEYDEPRRQEQGALQIDLAAGNIAIIGKADGSIERLISTTIWSSICDHTPAEVAYYIIDFGSETMKKFAKFPHVGEVVFQDEVDKVAGILSLITEEVNRRKELLSNYNGSFEYYNRTNQEKLSLIVAVVNNYDILSETLPKAVDFFVELFRDGPKYGITFIISASTVNAISSRQLQYFNHTILMQLSDDTQYRGTTNCRRGLIPRKVIGRGICKLDATNVDSYCEFQTAMIDTEEEELNTIKEYADECVEVYKCKVKQLAKVPDDVSSKDLAHHITTLSNVPIGINVYEKNLASYAFDAQKIHIITGKNVNENLGFIYALTTVLSKIPKVKVRVLDLIDTFKKPILDIQMLDQDPNAVFAALEKDVLTRTDSQDCSVNIIIGIGRYKQILSQGGLEVFRNLFDNIKNSKKSIYILIDNYESMRNIRLEKWYRDINTKQGIWLGLGLESQSIFEDIELGSEDKKFRFDGLAFSINDGKYSVIKTIMDKDD